MNSPEPRKRRKEARPSELTAAALELFVEKGFAATRLDDVAALAGVSKGTLYRYFTNKEELFKAVIREGVFPIVAAGEEMLARHTGSSFDLLGQILLGWWQTIGSTRLSGIPKLIIAEAGNFPEVSQYYYENVIRRGRALVAAALQRGMDSGEFRRMDVESCIDVVLAPVLLLVIWQHSIIDCQTTPPRPEAILRTQLDLLRQGLAAAEI